MFTGLVEHIGTITEYKPVDETGGVTIVIGDATPVLTDVHIGDSIATNGVCLTVTAFDEDKTQFSVGVAPETLRRTNLGNLKPGSKVNLERAVTADVRLGGHVVQGHVDTIASIVKRVPDGNAITFTFELREKQYITYIVEKGFIAIDGTSLTVTHVDHEAGQFLIMLISYLQGKVVLPLKEVQETVNIEVDLTGKLIEKQVELNLAAQIDNLDSPLVKLIERIVERKLRKA